MESHRECRIINSRARWESGSLISRGRRLKSFKTITGAFCFQEYHACTQAIFYFKIHAFFIAICWKCFRKNPNKSVATKELVSCWCCVFSRCLWLWVRGDRGMGVRNWCHPLWPIRTPCDPPEEDVACCRWVGGLSRPLLRGGPHPPPQSQSLAIVGPRRYVPARPS